MATNPWEIDWSQPQTQTADPSVRIGTPDPMRGLQQQRLQQQVTQGGIETQYAPQTIQAEAQRAVAEAERARAEAARTSQQVASGGLTGKEAEERRTAGARLNALTNQINRVQELYESTLKGKGPQAIREFALTGENKRFDSAAADLVKQAFAAFRVPGEGTQSDADLRLLLEASKPSTWEFDEGNEEKLLSLRAQVDARREALGLPPAEWKGQVAQAQTAPGTDRAAIVIPGATTRPGAAAETAAISGGGGGGLQTQLAQRGGLYATERDTDFQRRAQQLLDAGGSVEDANRLGQELGYTAPNGGPFRFDPAQWNEAQRYNRNVPQGQQRARIEVPETGITESAAVNELARTPVGTGFLSSANALTGFNLPRFTSNPEQARAGLGALAAENPISATLGTIGGGALAGAGLEAGLGLGGLRGGAGILAPRAVASDVLYGGTSGYGLGGENANAWDVLGGAAAGLGGGVVGRGVIGGIAGGIGPTGGGAAPLYREGVRPTPGQRFSQSGMFGRALNTGEQALQSVPFAGQAITGAREAARGQFETGAFNRALREIGTELPQDAERGQKAFSYARQAFNDAYDRARSGMQFVPDQQFGQELGNFQQNVLRGGLLDNDGVRQVERVAATSLGSRLRQQGGALSGDAYKKAISDIRQKAREISKPEVRKAVTELAGIVENAARRNSDPEAVRLLDMADRGYAQYAPLKEAGRMAGNDPGRFTPKNLESVERRTMGKTNAFLEGNTLMGDYIQAGRMLSDTLPTSGTSERAMTAGGAIYGLGGAGTAGAAGAGLAPTGIPLMAAAPFVPYLPGVRNAVGAMLAPRELPSLNQAANLLRRNQMRLGMFGAPIALEASQ